MLAADALVIDVVRRDASLVAIADEWRDLHARCPAASPFQSPAWLLPWWAHFGHQYDELTAIVARAGGRLVGLAPLYVRHDADGRRRLVFIGAGNSDYLDLLAEPTFAPTFADVVMRHVADVRRSWDACDWTRLPAESPLVRARVPDAWSSDVQPDEPCPVLAIRATEDGTFAQAAHGLLVNLRQMRRRAEALGITFELATPATLDEGLDALFALHAARWRAEAEPGVLADATVQAFHRAAARDLLRAGMLRLILMRLDGRIIAANEGFAHGRARYCYIGGFDPAMRHLSLGQQIVGEAIRRAVAEGAASLDMLAGREAYKYQWGAVDRRVCRRLVRAVQAG